jgi:hypothetical protein
MSRVFRKTAQGSAILARPNSGLTSFERVLLTMVDGKRTASDLRRLLAAFGNVNGLLRELFNDQLIEIDPGYAEKFATTQDEIARENVAIGGNFTATTTATIGKGSRLPTATRDLSDAFPQPLPQSLASELDRANSDAVPTLQLDPFGDEVRTPAISALAMNKAKSFSKQFVFDAVGAPGTALCLLIDRATDVKELLRATQSASKVLHDLKGAALGAEFDRRLRELLIED